MTDTELETTYFWRIARAAAQYLGKDARRAARKLIDGQNARDWLDDLEVVLMHTKNASIRQRAQDLYTRFATWLAPTRTVGI